MLGLSQKALGVQLGVDQGKLAKWERGEREPSGEFRARVAQFLNSSEAVWLEGSGRGRTAVRARLFRWRRAAHRGAGVSVGVAVDCARASVSVRGFQSRPVLGRWQQMTLPVECGRAIFHLSLAN
jgi:transcriptional regulator with XRE-family HTH domain